MLQLVTCESDTRWTRAAAASGQPVSPFHHPRFLRVAAAVTGRRHLPLVVRYRSTDVGVATWLERRLGPVASVNRVPFPYAGPLVPPDLLGDTLQVLWRHGLRQGAAVQTHQFTPDVEVDLGVLGRTPVESRHDETYVVGTGGTPEEIDAAIDPRARRQVRKSLSCGVSVVDERDAVPAAAALDRTLASIYAHKPEASGYREPLGVTPADLLGDGLEVSWLVARREGESVGCLVSVAFQDRAIAWLGGVVREHRGTYANVLLYREAIHWAHRVGARGIDLSGNPTPEIAAYKKQFGGALSSYPVLTHRPAWSRALARAQHEVRRRRQAPERTATGSSTAET